MSSASLSGCWPRWKPVTNQRRWSSPAAAITWCPWKTPERRKHPFKDYDADRMIAAIDSIKASGGGLEGLDVDAFLEDMLEAREQDTPGHSF